MNTCAICGIATRLGVAGWDQGTGAVTGPPIALCEDNVTQNGDLNFDGTPYRTEWPTGASPTSLYPSSFVESLPTSKGKQYSKWYVQTDVALSEDVCEWVSVPPANTVTTTGCSVPPAGSEVDQPGNQAFYPYWTEVHTRGTCTIEFGNASSGTGVNDFGKDAQYGSDLFPKLGYPEFEGKIHANTCDSH